MTESRTSFWQQLVLMFVSVLVAAFLGTYVGIEVVKEKITNMTVRMDKFEGRLDKLEGAYQMVLEAQVQVLTAQLKKDNAARR